MSHRGRLHRPTPSYRGVELRPTPVLLRLCSRTWRAPSAMSWTPSAELIVLSASWKARNRQIRRGIRQRRSLRHRCPRLAAWREITVQKNSLRRDGAGLGRWVPPKQGASTSISATVIALRAAKVEWVSMTLPSEDASVSVACVCRDGGQERLPLLPVLEISLSQFDDLGILIDVLWIFVRHLFVLESVTPISRSAARLSLYVVPSFPNVRTDLER